MFQSPHNFTKTQTQIKFTQRNTRVGTYSFIAQNIQINLWNELIFVYSNNIYNIEEPRILNDYTLN